MPGRRFGRRSSVHRVGCAAAAVLMVGGCSVVPDPLELAAGQLASAASTSELVLQQRHDHLTVTAASTALSDSTREVASATRSLVALRLQGRRDLLRAALLDRAVQLADALHVASEAVESDDLLRGVGERVGQEAERLSRLEAEVART